MASGFIVRLRPAGPWRLGPSTGARDRVDRVLHSDTLFSALTLAAQQLGILDEWLSATAQAAEPAVRVGSAFPFVGRTLLAPAPKHVWPPAASSRVRWKAARFVPLHVVPRLLGYESLKEDRWAVDPVSEAVLPVEKFGEVTPPFRVAMRRTAAVDRVTGVSAESATTACLEFAENAGMWCPVFCPPEWRDRVQSLFRLIADAGVGGERSLGWGRSSAPEFDDLPSSITTEPGDAPEHHETGYWLLSLFAPAPVDRVDWSRGSYSLSRRSGRTQHRGTLKVESAMTEEGSILIAEIPPTGLARDVAPEGSPHPVYRAGFAVAIPVSVRLPGFQELERAASVEQPAVAAVDAPSVDVPSEDVGETAELQETGEPSASVLSDDPAAEYGLSTEGAPHSGGYELPDVPEPPLPVEDHSDDRPEFVQPVNPDPGEAEVATEPVEDILAQAEPVPAPEYFVVETEPEAEGVPDPDNGEAFEDSPALPDADGDAIDKQPKEDREQ